MTIPLPLPVVPERLTRLRDTLAVRHDETQLRYAQLQGEVSQAKTRVGWQPEVQAFLETLQQQEHKRAVGVFETLLTSLLCDVLPGERHVVFDLYSDKGLPALDIFIRKGVGRPIEDPLSGMGGSVTNVLSVGLRMIAVVRSGMRPFLVLDESDCWLKPDLAPAFARVIQQASQQLGIQVLMISHHDESLFEDILPHRLHLEAGSMGLTAQWGPTVTPPVWSADQVGMRSMLLEHCQSHTHTFLPLSPGVTFLHGNNDLGKSTINTVLRAVFYAESNDTLIQHGSTFARATFDMGPEHLLSWERNLKGSPKVVYTQFTAADGRDQPLHKTAGAREAPTWLSTFRMGLIDGLDVQLAHQKKPVFLLDLPNTHRARALAIGGESAHVQTMMGLDKKDTTEARQTVKKGEQTLEQLHRRLRLLQPVIDGQARWDALLAQSDALQAALRQREAAEALACTWHTARAEQAARAPLVQHAPPALPLLPALEAPLRLQAAWRQQVRQLEARRPLRHQAAPQAPSAPTSEARRALAARWFAAQTARRPRHVLQESIAPQPPQPLLPPAWPTLADRWQAAVQAGAARRPLHQHPAPTTPPPAQTPHLHGLSARWAQAVQAVQVRQVVRTQALPAVPERHQTVGPSALQAQWRTAQERRRVLERVRLRPDVAPPPPRVSEQADLIVARWNQAQAHTVQLRDDQRHVDAALVEITEHLHHLECPTCHRAWQLDSEGHAA